MAILDLTIKNARINENTLIWAVAASILLHVLFAVVVPAFKFDPIKKEPEILKVELLPPPAPPAPVVVPEEPAPAPVPEKKIVEPKPVEKPITKKVEAPSPTKEEYTPPPAAVEGPPKVIAAEPKADSTPQQTVPVPAAPVEKPHPPEPSPADVDNALGEYGSLLGRAIAKHKSYPAIAVRRNLEGEILLDIKLDGSGKVLSASIRQSSGHDVLDNQALEMVRKASPFPAPPEALRNRTFNITVPVSFKLEPA